MSKSSAEASLCSRVSVWASFASMMFLFNQIVPCTNAWDVLFGWIPWRAFHFVWLFVLCKEHNFERYTVLYDQLPDLILCSENWKSDTSVRVGCYLFSISHWSGCGWRLYEAYNNFIMYHCKKMLCLCSFHFFHRSTYYYK